MLKDFEYVGDTSKLQMVGGKREELQFLCPELLYIFADSLHGRSPFCRQGH